MAEAGILSLPEGDDVKGEVEDAEGGTLVDSDSLGAGEPPLAVLGVGVVSPLAPAEPLRRDEICWSEGKRVIFGLHG